MNDKRFQAFKRILMKSHPNVVNNLVMISDDYWRMNTKINVDMYMPEFHKEWQRTLRQVGTKHFDWDRGFGKEINIYVYDGDEG